MNEQNLDKLFKDKLADYSMTPNVSASDKLDDMFATRKRRIGWKFARFAAAILLVAISLYAIHRWGTTTPEQYAESTPSNIEQTPAKEFPKLDPPVAAVEEDITNNSSPNVTESHKSTDTPSKQRIVAVKSTPLITKQPPASTAIAINSSESVATEKEKMIEQSESTIEAETQTLSSENKPKPVRKKVTITYKKSSNPPDPMLALQPEPKQKNNGRLKRIWKNLNPGDISLAGFRATKDQILVINKKGKDTKSN